MNCAMNNAVGTIALGVATIGLAGCYTPTEPEPKPVTTPLEAMQTTPAPPAKGEVGSESVLMSDLEQLQDARTKYERATEDRRARDESQQVECRRSENAKEVPVQEGGVTTATFCQQVPEPG